MDCGFGWPGLLVNLAISFVMFFVWLSLFVLLRRV